MKKWMLVSLIFLVITATLVGFSKINTISNAASDMATGTEKVLTLIEEFEDLLEEEPNNYKEIKALGIEIEEEWDQIEKTIEKNYPDEYKDIEESLYPLLSLSQEDSLNIKKLEELTDQVESKLDAFLKKIN